MKVPWPLTVDWKPSSVEGMYLFWLLAATGPVHCPLKCWLIQFRNTAENKTIAYNEEKIYFISIPPTGKYKRKISCSFLTYANMPLTLPLQHWWFVAPLPRGYWFCHVLWYYWTHQCNKGLHPQAPVLQLPNSTPQIPSQQSLSNLKNQILQSVSSLKCGSELEWKTETQHSGLSHGQRINQQGSSITYFYHVTQFILQLPVSNPTSIEVG